MPAASTSREPDPDWRPSASLEILRLRAEMMARCRTFFAARQVLEVDTPVLQGGANLDPGSQSLPVACGAERRFLPTSPEHPLKRLVAAGYGPVWTLAPAFRHGERSRRHQPEFRMLEWYRPGWDHRQLLEETLALLHHLTGWEPACETITYRQAFLQHCGLDPERADTPSILAQLGSEADLVGGDRDAAIDLLLARHVEPHLGRHRLTAVTDYPLRLAAQARLRADHDGHPAAARFELYRQGIELANGYWELTDASELAARLEHHLRIRADAALVRDQRFEMAMAAGLPECAGVAVGFDRVLMLASGCSEVANTMAFAWDRA
jgi:lysyl-tRNA synthetase class 2